MAGTDPVVDITELYAAHRLSLVRLAILLVDDFASAEDVVQDAFAALARRPDAVKDPTKALAYLRQSVVNRSRSVLRHRGVVDRHAAAERPPEPLPSAEGPALSGDRRGTVLDAMRALPQRQREVLALRYYLDLDEASIAEYLGISRGAVKSHASRGAAALRDLLGDRS